MGNVKSVESNEELIKSIAMALTTDEEPAEEKGARIRSLYQEADNEGKELLDTMMIDLCGYSLDTLGAGLSVENKDKQSKDCVEDVESVESVEDVESVESVNLNPGDSLFHPLSLDIIEHKVVFKRVYEDRTVYVSRSVHPVGACGRVEVELTIDRKGVIRFID